MTIDPSSTEPLYVQLARILRQQVADGTVPLGALMPSEHQLRGRHGVNRSVARQAYQLLETEGLVVSRRGIGRCVAAVPQLRTVPLGPGDEVRARMPGEDERARLGIGHGIPVLVITRAAGGEEAHSAAAAVCRCTAAAGGPLCPPLA